MTTGTTVIPRSRSETVVVRGVARRIHAVPDWMTGRGWKALVGRRYLKDAEGWHAYFPTADEALAAGRAALNAKMAKVLVREIRKGEGA